MIPPATCAGLALPSVYLTSGCATNDSDGFWRVAPPAVLLLYGGQEFRRRRVSYELRNNASDY